MAAESSHTISNVDDELFYPKITGKLLLLHAANEGGRNSREKLLAYTKYEEKASSKPLAINVRACLCVCRDCKVSEKSEPRRKIDKIISNSGTVAHLKLNTRNRLHTQHTLKRLSSTACAIHMLVC